MASQLFTAIYDGRIKTVQTLLSKQKKINSVNSCGDTLLHAAVKTNNKEIVKLLLEAGAKVNSRNTSGETALHHAASNIISDDPTMFEILLEANANPNAKNNAGDHPIHHLIKNRYNNKISLFEIFKVFKKYKANFNLIDANGFAPIDNAILHSDLQAVKALVLSGKVDVNSQFMPNENHWEAESILHQACYDKDIPIVKFLLETGADVNVTDYYGGSPLLRVLELLSSRTERNSQARKLVECLLEWNPNLNATIKTDNFNIESVLRKSASQSALPNWLWPILIQHLAKRAIQHPLDNSLSKLIFENPKYNEYFSLCNQEIQTIKNHKLQFNNSVTFYNLLIDDKKTLANANLSKNIPDINDIVGKFPIYGNFIHKRLTEAIYTVSD